MKNMPNNPNTDKRETRKEKKEKQNELPYYGRSYHLGYDPETNDPMKYATFGDKLYDVFHKNPRVKSDFTQFAMGGMTPPQYEAEGGEVVDGGMPSAFGGGNISPNSSQSAMITGASHEQGGVEMSGGERVFSDRLNASKEFAPKSKKTYAQVANTLTKKIGDLEDKSKSSDRFAKETAKRMLPVYQSKLDKLFEEQEASKQQAFQKDYNQLQMKYGGDLTKYGLGGDIAAGLVGITGGALGTIPVVGDMAQKGLYALNDRLDPNMTDQSKSIRGFGQAAGGIATGAITGNLAGGIGQAAQGIGTGINEGTDGEYSDIVDPLTGLAGMAGKFMAYGGKLPKFDDGGNPPYSVDNPPTYREWLATRPDLTSGELEVYQDYISNPDMVSQFNPENIYRGNSGIGSEYPYVEPGMASQYNQSQTQLRPGTPAPIQSEMYKDYSTTGTLTDTGAYEKPAPTNTEKTITNDPNQEKSVSENPQMGGGNQPSTLQDLLYKGAAYAPTIYNAVRGMQKPQVLDHEEFQNPYEKQAMGLMSNRRYDIDPQLQSNRSTLNNMKTNLRNYAGGNAGTYLSNMGNLQMNTDRMNEQAYATKNNMDNQYMAQEAQFMGGMGANRAQTKFNIQDVNDRNKAARDAHMGKAVEGMSGIAQNNKRMNNMSARDVERLMALDKMYADYGYDYTQGGKFTGFNYKG